jgi:microcin C transport system substrate-binding protein
MILPRRFLGAAAICAAWSAALVAGAAAQAPAQKVTVAHAFAMHGDVKYGPDFKHFDYADPNAVKGGEVKYEAIGQTFDTLNPFTLRGVPGAGSGSIYDTLMVASADEPFTKYCLVCETIEVPQDRSWVAFNLRPEAKFQDGKPITPEDVIWTFETLKTKGHPRYRAYYASAVKAEKVGERKVRFAFSPGENQELPLILGELPVLPKHWWDGKDFEKTILEPPLGSGAYKIDSFEAGRFVTIRRVPDYWAARLPVNVGQNNFDVIRFEYFRDRTIALEAFKAGAYDIRVENQALAWATRFDSPARAAGLFKMEELPTRLTTGMQGFAMNLRRPVFQDRRVREALSLAFDFEWSNKNLFHGAYTRTRSYFDNSELSATGLPSAEELKLLEPLRGQIPPEVFTKEYNPPRTDGTGNWRDNQRIATRLLNEAGYKVVNQLRVGPDGKQMSFEILLSSPQFERIALPYVENLKRLGIDARVRTVDTAQYQRRMDEFDYDMTVESFGQSESPGNEQRDFWSSAAAGVQGSRNTIGIKSNAIDALIEAIIAAPDRDSLVTRTRALDRVLQWEHYMVPNWHSRTARVAYWDRFSRPKELSKYGYLVSTWWVDPQKDAALRQKRGQAPQ